MYQADLRLISWMADTWGSMPYELNTVCRKFVIKTPLSFHYPRNFLMLPLWFQNLQTSTDRTTIFIEIIHILYEILK